ncbi:lipocalin family protein [Polaribacter vadi]|uniref:lipocalin family protein n=1 Tax=Polaribacter TaxID=52959 RepID=UPI001C096E20|nr:MULTISPECIES: lipocalin family protein [Polaribacter]MBU3011942.1 lipocalin family protein [Polaribacter vadi]MDO6741757.1 lipocalin family protein [Polaribacter sp. 1_MG-2023]
MKKNLIFLLFLATMISCKSTSVVNTKVDNKTERILKGNWTITSVNYPGSDYINVESFYLADSKCFVNSNWNFISNNNKGDMKLNNSSSACIDYSSPITWYLNKEGQFVLKFTNDYKAKEVSNGFVLTINNVTETSFDLVDKINVAGSIKNITYTFQKN